MIEALTEIKQEENNIDKKKGICRYENKMVSPRYMEEAHIIVDYLREERYVIELDLEKADIEEAQRIIDFISGAVYMSKGTFQHLKEKKFWVAPYDADIEI